MRPLYRIYDALEKRHNEDLFIFSGYSWIRGTSFQKIVPIDNKYRRYILERFSGLVDKNGQDIYENDMLLCEVWAAPHRVYREDTMARYAPWNIFDAYDQAKREIVGHAIRDKHLLD